MKAEQAGAASPPRPRVAICAAPVHRRCTPDACRVSNADCATRCRGRVFSSAQQRHLRPQKSASRRRRFERATVHHFRETRCLPNLRSSSRPARQASAAASLLLPPCMLIEILSSFSLKMPHPSMPGRCKVFPPSSFDFLHFLPSTRPPPTISESSQERGHNEGQASHACCHTMLTSVPPDPSPVRHLHAARLFCGRGGDTFVPAFRPSPCACAETHSTTAANLFPVQILEPVQSLPVPPTANPTVLQTARFRECACFIACRRHPRDTA